MRTAIALLVWMLLTGLQPALGQSMRLVLGQTQVLDGGVDTTRVEPNTFTSALKFILGSDATLQVGDLSDAQSGTPVDAFRVTSALQSLRGSVLWTGELRGAAGRSNDPVKLGPVTLADEKGLRGSALAEIAALIKRQLSKVDGAAPRPVSIYTCLTPDSSKLARELADEFRQHFVPQLKIADLVPVLPPPPCDGPIGALAENTARVTGRIAHEGGMLVIEPVLEWKGSTIPLPVLREELKLALNSAEAYVLMLSRATTAAFRDYPPEVMALLSAAAANDWQENRQALISYPYLTAAILQRRDVRNDPVEVRALHFYQLGRAFADTRELEAGKAAFERSRQLRNDWIDPVRELGTLLFEFQRHDEAKTVFEAALALDSEKKDLRLQEKYAQAAYLLGKKDDARRALDALLEKPGASASAWLLGARVATDDGDFVRAASRAKSAKALAPGDRAVHERLAREIALKVIEAAPKTPAEFDSAREALDLIEERRDTSPNLLVLKGAVRLRQGLSAEPKGAGAAEARQNLAAAIEYYRQAAATGAAADPELEMLDLDIAEALFFSAAYASDDQARRKALEDSARAARGFITKEDQRGLGLASFRPVAQFLIAAGDFLLGRSKDPWSDLQSRIPEGAETPTLFVSVPTGKDNTGTETSTRIRLAQWSFSMMHEVACRLPPDQRSVILELTDRTQARINALPKRTAC